MSLLLPPSTERGRPAAGDERNRVAMSGILYFVDAYLRGETPNPCLHCNPRIKFGIGLDHALERGVDFLASGHYCRIRRERQGVRLVTGLDRKKGSKLFSGLFNPGAIDPDPFPGR